MDAAQVGSGVSREEFRELAEAVRELQLRIAALEQHAPVPVPHAPAAPLPDVHVTSDVLPTAGRALFAIAGAYLLRALTEWQILPLRAGVVLGMLYAGFWLWHATRASGKLGAIVNAITAVFIFGPLTWEAMINLHAIPAWTAAGALAVFSTAAVRRREVAAIAAGSSALIGVVLMLGTHDLIPFTCAVLIAAAVSDWTILPGRWIGALCADAAIAIVVLIAASPLPEGYVPFSNLEAMIAVGAPLAIFGGGTVLRTALRGRSFTLFEIGQLAIAFVLSLGGALYLTHASRAIGAVALGLGMLSYGLIWVCDRRDLGVGRGPGGSPTGLIYSAFGGLLTLAAGLLLLSGMSLVLALVAVGIVLAWTPAGPAQAPVFLWAAMWISGIAANSALALFEASPGFSRMAAAILITAGAIAYWRVARPLAAGLIASAILWAGAGFAASFGAGAVIFPVFAIALAWSAAHFKRAELTWLMYTLMVAGGCKILFRDFSRESAAALVLSLLVYGAALIAIPRISQKR